MTVIRVAHAGASYEVLIISLTEALRRLTSIAAGRRLPLISDRRVFDLYGERFAPIAPDLPILVPEGEAAKDWRVLAEVIDGLAVLDVKRGTPIIALGGGSIVDVAGLAASLFKRGCPIIHVPTTLLAQADSAIGGKTAIDAAGQKNLVGNFHHPMLVIADPALLDTLDERQMRSGYAEVVKYGLIGDPGFFEWCEANGGAVTAGVGTARRAVIEHCIRAKARFVDDPAAAVSDADAVIGSVMGARGYPVADFDARYKSLTVDHTAVAQHYRAGHDIALSSLEGKATTEELRQAMIHYEALFGDLAEEEAPPQVAERAS